MISNVLDLWGVVDPARIQYKYKLHVLSHLNEDIRRFGPAILFSAEVFECWSAVFRLCSVLSNHQAPSRDTTATLVDKEHLKHPVSGGWWKGPHGNYLQAGVKIRSFLCGNRKLQRRLGWVDPAAVKAGEFGLVFASCHGLLNHPRSIRHGEACSSRKTNRLVLGDSFGTLMEL